MDFKSILDHLSGPAKENKIFYSEPEIQAQRDAVDNLKKTGVSQMVVEAQERRLADMEAKKQQTVDKKAVDENLSFLNPATSDVPNAKDVQWDQPGSFNPDMRMQFADPNSVRSSFDVNVSDTTVPMNGRVDNTTPTVNNEPPKMLPFDPMAPAPESQSAPAAGGPGKSRPDVATPPEMKHDDIMQAGLNAAGPNMDQAKRDAFDKEERNNRIKMLFPEALAGFGDAIAAGGGNQQDSLGRVLDIKGKEEKSRKEDFEKAFLNDPKSGMSKIAQSAAARLLGKKPEEMVGLSLAQIDKAFPIWKEALNNEQALELKKLQIEAMKQAREDRRATSKEHADDKATQFKEKQIQQIRQNLTSGKGFQNMQSIDYNGRIIEDSLKNPNGYGDLGAMFAFMKALDPTSVVREGEQDRFTATASLPTAMVNTLNKWATGKTLQPEQRKQVADFAKKMRGHAIEQYKQGAKPSLEQATRLGYNLSEIDPMFEDAPQAAAAQGGNRSVVKKQYSKSADKTKLIYSDGTEEIVDGRK